MPPITCAAAQAVSSWDGTTLTVPVPRATRVGDMLLAALVFAAGDAAPAPDGWEQIGLRSGATNQVGLYRRVADDAEPASYAFVPVTPVGSPWGAVLVYRGAAVAAALVAQAHAELGVSASHAAPSIAATAYSDMLLCVWAVRGTSIDYTPPVGMTSRVESVSAGTTSVLVADKLPEVTGATGAQAATLNVAAAGIACSFLIKAGPLVEASDVVRDQPGSIGIVEVG